MIFFFSCKLLIFNTHCYLCFFLFVFSWTVLADLCGPFTYVMWWRGIYSKARGKIAVKLKALAYLCLKLFFMFHLKCKLIRAVLSQIYFWTHIWKGKLLWMTVIILTVPTLTMTEGFFCQNCFFCLALPCVDPNRHIPSGGLKRAREALLNHVSIICHWNTRSIHENSVLFENVAFCK